MLDIPHLTDRLQSRAGAVRAQRGGGAHRAARRRRPGHGALGPGLASRRALWIASAMTDEDIASPESRRPRRARIEGLRVPPLPKGERSRGLRPLLQRDRQPDAVVHPALPLGPLERAGHPAGGDRGVRVRLQRRQRGPRAAVVEEIESESDPLVMLHDYHLYTAPGMIRAGAPRRLPASLRPHPWSQPDSWRVLPGAGARRSTAACSPTTSSAFTPPPTAATSCTAAGSCWSSTSTTASWQGAPPRAGDLGARLSARDRRRAAAARRRLGGGRRGRARGAGAPPRAPDHPRRPRRPLEERAARLHRLRHLP